METVSRTLGIHAEHELLLKLEAAGIAEIAQAIIESPHNRLAQCMVDWVKHRIKPEVTHPATQGSTLQLNFTDRVRRVTQTAREEVARWGHHSIGTEHLLLGLIHENEGVAAAVFSNIAVDREVVREKTEARMKRGSSQKATSDLPYTSRGKKVLELAFDEARELGHSYAGGEHLLLGLIREERGVAGQVLTELGLSLEQVRTEVLRVLGQVQ